MPSFMSTYLVSTAGFSASLTSSSNFHYHHRALLSFPTRRSSDLDLALQRDRVRREKADAHAGDNGLLDRFGTFQLHRRSEEHTSESSHRTISYAVFCLKKKNRDLGRFDIVLLMGNFCADVVVAVM